MLGRRVLFAILSLGCGPASHERDGSAEMDAGVSERDGSVGDMDAGQRDGSIGDARVAACSDVPLTASCRYGGYGSMCPVPCSFPPTCSFTVLVGWTDGYCCGGTESFVDCRCEGGVSLCASWSGGVRGVPTTFCEFCDRDSGP